MACLSVGMVFRSIGMMTVSAQPDFMQASAMRFFWPRLGVLTELLHPSMYPRRISQEFFGNLALVTLDFEFAQPGCGDTSSAFMCSRTSFAIVISKPCASLRFAIAVR